MLSRVNVVYDIQVESSREVGMRMCEKSIPGWLGPILVLNTPLNLLIRCCWTGPQGLATTQIPPWHSTAATAASLASHQEIMAVHSPKKLESFKGYRPESRAQAGTKWNPEQPHST